MFERAVAKKTDVLAEAERRLRGLTITVSPTITIYESDEHRKLKALWKQIVAGGAAALGTTVALAPSKFVSIEKVVALDTAERRGG